MNFMQVHAVGYICYIYMIPVHLINFIFCWYRVPGFRSNVWKCVTLQGLTMSDDEYVDFLITKRIFSN